MALQNAITTNFSSGELSPKVRARADLPLHQSGLERMSNFIAETQGPARYRAGTRYVHHTRGNKTATIIPFQFNDEQSYILEFTDLKFRIYRDGGIVIDTAKTISGATQANPVVLTATAHGFSNGDEVFIDSVIGMTDINSSFFLVANVTANTFELQDIDGVGVNGIAFTAYSSGGNVSRVVEITSPYTEAQLFDVKFSQNADVMYLAHSSHAPRKITRTSHTAWTLVTYTRTSDPFTSSGNFPATVAFYESRLGFAATNNNPETFWLSRAPDNSGNPRYDDFSLGTGVADDAVIFTLAPVNGKVDTVRWLFGNTRFLAVGTFGGASRVDGGSDDTAITPTNIRVRPLDSFGSSTVRPVTAGGALLYVQRGGLIIRSLEFDFSLDSYVSVDRNLVSDHLTETGVKQLAFQNGRPDLLWGVRNDGLLISLTLKTKEDVSGWHRHPIGGGAKVLSVGTLPQEKDHDQVWVVVERTINGVTRRYVEFIAQAVKVAETLDFFTEVTSETSDSSKFANRMYELQRNAKHLDSHLVFDGSARGSAASASVTPAATSGTAVTFTASAAVFTSADVGNEIWKKFVIGTEAGRATITGFTSSTVVTCEITVGFDSVTAMASGAWYLTALAISGLDHLSGSTIGVVTDGAVHPDRTVTSGKVTLDYEAAIVVMGYRYKGIIKTMNLEIGGEGGPAQTKIKNIKNVGLRLFGTLGLKLGTDIYDIEAINFRSTADLTDRPPPLFTGVKFITVEDNPDREKHLYLVQESPLPCVIQQADIFMDTTNE